MCNACGFVCCALDSFGECGCDDCDEIDCMQTCERCGGIIALDLCECSPDPEECDAYNGN